MDTISGGLPADLHPGNTCFFTGHRFLADGRMTELYTPLVRCILQAQQDGYRYFVSGGALGFDLLAAETVALLRQQYRKEMFLVLALPCRDQTAKWLQGKRGMDSIRRYHDIKAQAESVVYLTDFYKDGCMQDRNRFMVSLSSLCIACWNGSVQGGTAQTVRMAEKAGIPVWNIHPDGRKKGER